MDARNTRIQQKWGRVSAELACVRILSTNNYPRFLFLHKFGIPHCPQCTHCTADDLINHIRCNEAVNVWLSNTHTHTPLSNTLVFAFY